MNQQRTIASFDVGDAACSLTLLSNAAVYLENELEHFNSIENGFSSDDEADSDCP